MDASSIWSDVRHVVGPVVFGDFADLVAVNDRVVLSGSRIRLEGGGRRRFGGVILRSVVMGGEDE